MEYFAPGLNESLRDATNTPVPEFDTGTARPIRYLSSRRVSSSGDPASFSDRFGNWTTSEGGTAPRNPNLPNPPPAGRRPASVFDTGAPPLLTPIPDSQQADVSVSPVLRYLQMLKQQGGNNPQTLTPALAPDDSSFTGGLPGRLAALAGIDPNNQDVPSRQDGDWRGYDDDPTLPWWMQSGR